MYRDRKKTDYDYGRSVVQTSDGGYALAGYTRIHSDMPEDLDFWLVKVAGPSPIARTHRLIGTIETWNLPKGIENSLTSKLDGAIHLLNKGKENGAIHKLMAFINQVEALREKKLTTHQADQLTSEAQRIIDLINR